MSTRRKTLILLGLAVFGGAAGVLFAVLRRPAEPDLRAWLVEYDSLQRSLETLRDRAFSDPVVAGSRAQLSSAIAGHMRGLDPDADSLLERADTLESQMERARLGESLDPRTYARLLREYEEIRATLEPAERAAFLDPEIQRQFEAFRRLLDTKMLELATAAERRALGRIREIEAKIQALPPEVFDSVTAAPEGDA